MTDILLQIPGPLFIGLFFLLFFVCLFGGKLLTKFDGSMSWRMPEPTRFSPVAIAAFSGGASGVIRTTLFSMINKKVIAITGEGPLTRVTRLKKKDHGLTDPVELLLFDYLKTSCSPRDIFSDPELEVAVDEELQPYYREFEDLRLMQGDSDRFWIWLVTVSAVAVAGGIGGMKLWLGITYSKPVGVLVVLLILAIPTLIFFLKPRAYGKTRLGNAYLEKLQTHFDWLKESLDSGDVPDGIDPAFPLALYGPGILSGLAAYTVFSGAFTPSSRASGAGCGSGCGSGCSGGGCGSGCGGGCGGCGGCG